MSRHASAEDLAMLDLDALKPREAARIRAHVTTCAQCTKLSSEVSAVPATLASVSYPVMPEQLSVRIDTVLAAESAQRLASAPATEAGRRDLPERSRHARKPGGRWHLPGMSVLATRLAAAASALVIVGVGGYEIASHAGSNVAGTAASSSGTAAAPNVAAGRMSFGPSVQYGEPTSTKTVRTVSADTNFTPEKLGRQALAAVEAAKLRGVLGAQPTTGAAPTANAKSAKSTAVGGTTPSEPQLASCLDGIVGSKSVLLVETARFEGKPATIIVTAQTTTREAEVWAVGPTCSASHPDVLDHLRLSRT
jgi:anti-sigma factor ChrR (cupin superfamily)